MVSFSRKYEVRPGEEQFPLRFLLHKKQEEDCWQEFLEANELLLTLIGCKPTLFHTRLEYLGDIAAGDILTVTLQVSEASPDSIKLTFLHFRQPKDLIARGHHHVVCVSVGPGSQIR